ncbi:MAG TPA: YecA family protein [Thiotrichales bacterium]|nr:YecA family protein [Thiotrichales bacterium]
MLPEKELRRLAQLLAEGENPDETFSLDRLLGYLYALAITPEPLAPGEWVPPIFGNRQPEFATLAELQRLMDGLTGAYRRLRRRHQQGRLLFPWEMQSLRPAELDRVRQWVHGFLDGVRLRVEFWLGEGEGLGGRDAEEAEYSIAVLHGVVFPEDMEELFHTDEMLGEATPWESDEERRLRLSATLFALLPTAVENLQRCAAGHGGASPPAEDPPCPCGSGRPFSRCCGTIFQRTLH